MLLRVRNIWFSNLVPRLRRAITHMTLQQDGLLVHTNRLPRV